MYDLIILGGGPAGLSAALYAARAKLQTLVIESKLEGGQISNTTDVENYPGIAMINGAELGMIMKKQAVDFGAEFVYGEVTEVNLEDETKLVKTKDKEYQAKAVIIATGSQSRKIGCPGEDEYAGKGISYCATCDAAFYEDLDVYVVGGGNSALDEALFITNFARKVYIIHRRDELRASKVLQSRAFANDKIEFIWDTTVKEIKGDVTAKELVLENLKTGEVRSITSDEPFGIFVFIGSVPNTKLFEDQVDMEKGYIKTDDEMRTNLDGVFAAGDLRIKTVRQVVTAASDGAIAAVNAQKYIAEKEGKLYEGFKEN